MKFHGRRDIRKYDFIALIHCLIPSLLQCLSLTDPLSIALKIVKMIQPLRPVVREGLDKETRGDVERGEAVAEEEVLVPELAGQDRSGDLQEGLLVQRLQPLVVTGPKLKEALHHVTQDPKLGFRSSRWNHLEKSWRIISKI